MNALLRSASVLALSAVALAANADIVTALAGAPVATGDGFYAYTYNVQLSGGQLDPVSGGTPVQFGTVYDFGPLVTTAGTLNNPASPNSVFIAKTGLLADSRGQFSFSFDGTDAPAPGATGFTDNPALTNVRFTYVGSTGVFVSGQATTLGGGAMGIASGSANLGTFTVYSPISALSTSGTYDGLSYKGTNNTAQANVGQVSVPRIMATPEPGTWAALGLGAVTLLRRRKRA